MGNLKSLYSSPKIKYIFEISQELMVLNEKYR